MTPLQRLEALDTQITALQRGQPAPVDGLAPLQLRQRFFGDLALFWKEAPADGHSRFQRLMQLRHEQLLAELELRLADQTLGYDAIVLLRTCLASPRAWQRRHLPTMQRAQLYRPVFSSLSPNRRLHLRGALVLVAGSPEGSAALPGTASGLALLCSLSHGIEAFANLAELHTELCERLDDPLQSQPMLQLLPRIEDQQLIQQADQLRYEWFAEDMVEQQVQDLIDVQRERLAITWQTAWQHEHAPDLADFSAMLANQQGLLSLMGCKHALATRYALLLEKHLPSWLRNASAQGLAHIMQTMQELAGAITQAAAPGLLTLEQFSQHNHLLAWVRDRLGEQLRREHGIHTPAEQILVKVTMARRKGPLLNPLAPSSYIAAASRPQVGDTIEMVPLSYRLDELALLNIAWFDVEYWLTARVQRADGSALPRLTPAHVKRLVRNLDAGSGYLRYLRHHLLDSAAGRWRMQAHGAINRARMHAEAAKARYAGHFLNDPLEQGYRWVRAIIHYPDSGWRPTIEEHRIVVRQLLIDGHTLHGVLLLNAEVASVQSLVVYTPDAPDRRAWREFRNTRDLLRTLRNTPALREYVIQRAPQANRKRLDKLLRMGRLGPYVQRPIITGNLYQACYRAEVQMLMAEADSNSRSNNEVLGEFSLATLRLILDLISLVLPAPAMSALAFGRMAISIWDGVEAMHRDDYEATLHHAIAALSHTADGLNSFAGSTLMRRALRGLPPQPPRPLPKSHEAAVDISKLRYRIDGVHGEKVYEQISATAGPDRYFVKDSHGRMYSVNFDGQRWRALDPRQPDAYVQLPLKRLRDGTWVVDSPVLWHDGLPDLSHLFETCRLQPEREGLALATEDDLHEADGQLYLLLAGKQLPVRRHLLPSHYHLSIPQHALGAVHAWAVLRRQNGQWRIRVRQPGRSSDWLTLPADYSANPGSSRSSR
ncbi:hypothetical protein LJD21_05200 [Pseudomonas inefficax]|uniref:dermonecrotic toxin domain-containing protein n=1 Tax=Pseudomonas inefficax TaxID=2078786 RepID=UPI00207BA930|nr:DUF6543 domain-containing protein [Pseudomonas inefficax]MCM8911568.1 hypothetical protein [Pseudomonas inefficax]